MFKADTGLDYCNTPLLGISAKLITVSYRIQNISARMITGCRRHDHITPLSKELPWLPVNERNQFTTFVVTYKSLNGRAPPYLAELIHEKVDARTPRLSSEPILDVPKYKLKAFGPNVFSIAAPTLWNKLLNQIKTA